MSGQWGGRKVERLTALVKAEFGFICHLCLKPITDESNYTVDHIVARNHGGTDDLENLRPAHGKPCNFSRGDKSVEQFRASNTDATAWFLALDA